MRYEIIYEPVPIIIIRDLFSEEQNKDILNEAIENESKFEHAVIGSGKKPDFRSNKVAYYDDIYNEDRSKSKLLDRLDKIFKTSDFAEVLNSAPYPIYKFGQSNHHETQVSRYGDKGQLYQYHVDAFGSNKRQLTVVYYFHEEPKQWTGGDILFTNSPIFNGKPVDNNAKILKMTPENNMAVIFGARIPHMVEETTSPEAFNKGRFSVNCWIGIS